MNEILTIAQMTAADRYAAAHGVSEAELMENAGRAVAEAIMARWTKRPVAVLCGPGNNGGDGRVVARLLKARGWDVHEEIASRPSAAGWPAALREAEMTASRPSAAGWPAALREAEIIVDALFGAGLSRPLEGKFREMAEAANAAGVPVVAIDVPSGLNGDTGKIVGSVCFQANLTVTFFRKKPAHVLMPGRDLCGEIVVADIGIAEAALEGVSLFENGPTLWEIPRPQNGGNKYIRGHCIVVSGPAHATGAARLAARAALRVGAGLVSVASPKDAVAVNAAALTAVMVKPFASRKDFADLLGDKRITAIVIGPGCGVGARTRALVEAVLATRAGAVLDADALTSFKDDPKALFAMLHGNAVLTPHEGEFERIFPGLLKKSASKIEAVRKAAKRAGCVVLLKGADTVIAAPDVAAERSGLAGGAARGRNQKIHTIVNTNAPPTLATAGSGDVLSGLIGGLLAQGVDAQRAAAAAAWLHGAAAQAFGPGLIAEDLPEMLPKVLAALEAGKKAVEMQ
jgi:NAD(P)H-hydrate epimerase